jgi:hypothetical protein
MISAEILLLTSSKLVVWVRLNRIASHLQNRNQSLETVTTGKILPWQAFMTPKADFDQAKPKVGLY